MADEQQEQDHEQEQDEKDEKDEQTHEEAAEEMREFEKSDEVPSDLSEWPSGKAKYVTFGEASDSAYGEGPTEKLGPAEVTHHEDGSVTVAGEEANAEDYKAEPVKSGVVEQIEKSVEKYREIQREHPDLQSPDDDGAGDGDEDRDDDADEPEKAAGAADDGET